MDVTKHADEIPESPKIALGKYRHYKGNMYEVVGVGSHTETLEYYVVYKPIYENAGTDIWIRPYDMFVDSVEINGEHLSRFQKIDD